MKKTIIICIGVAAAVAALAAVWCNWFAPTRIAFVNYQVSNLGQIAKSNENNFIRIKELPTDKLNKAKRFDMVFVNAMGMRITELQREELRKAAENGLPVLSTAVTNPANNIVSLDSLDEVNLKQYLEAGGRSNFRNMLHYVRKHIDGKILSAPEAGPAVEPATGLIYHFDTEDPDAEGIVFNSISEYENYLRRAGLYSQDAPKILLTGQMGEPTELTAALEEAGYMVYPVTSHRVFFSKGHADSVDFSAVINMAHGRMGDLVTDWLSKKNIPLFAPLNINSLVEDWENDNMGMSSGFLSQSVVTPEIDGAIRPFVLFGNYVDEKDGLQYLHAIPERLEAFVETVGNYIDLQRKSNKDKKIAIYYFKGPGQGSLVASGMDVVPSLYNLLLRLKAEGYDVSGLPSSASALENLIAAQGFIPENITSQYVTDAKPEIINSEQYNNWLSQSLSETMRKETFKHNGAFPGSYMATPDGNLALPRIRFGNIVLMPQLAAGLGDNDFEIVHGTGSAPPHAYIASYLWTQFGFEADALIHFGAHGSLEFTPRKQVALSRNDWSDRLVGNLPHFYVYTISNVGEAMSAKRRSYAGLHSYLTPPFMESGVRTQYQGLTQALQAYENLLGNDVQDAKAIEKASLKVKASVLELGINKELELDSIPDKAYSEAEISKIANFAEELVSEKITGKSYIMGEAYTDEEIRSTVVAMCAEPLAYGLYAKDKEAGRAPEGLEKNKPLFNRRYLTPAKAKVVEILKKGSASSDDELLKNIVLFANYLKTSPQAEIESIINGLNGGFTPPSPGGDLVANPNVLPTGRNLFAINAEATPSERAWEKGKQLAENTIALYRERHNDSIPRKVSYTLWSSEFIETEGATIAQILYMLGVEPIRDRFGRVTDLRLIPSETLGRPRIDVVVQTSGQLRDLAASRLFLISRAVEMAAAAKDDVFENQVAKGVLETEKILIDKGISPKQAREISTYRVFGGVDGNYGTGIQGMVQAGDSWKDEAEIAQVYLNNMGAYYGSEDKWENFSKSAFEAALSGTDAVVQPRQSNTWGALSLDHVYEFMGGMNLAVRNVTGKDPDAYLSDYRNRNNFRMQEVKEAIGVESRTTIFNPNYIRQKMKGGAADAAELTEIVRNTYGWNVMKPKAIDNEMWDRIYDVYVNDSYNLGVREFFREKNPQALKEMSEIMLETAGKGLWKASTEQLAGLNNLQASLESTQVMDAEQSAEDGIVMKKEDISLSASSRTNILSNTIMAAVAAVAVIFIILFVRKRRKNAEE